VRPPKTTRVGFRHPFLRRSPRLAGLAQEWLQDYSRVHSGSIRSITLIVSGEPPKIQLWVELPALGGHIDKIVMGVQELLDFEAQRLGMVLVPKSLIDKFSKPLDFRTTKC
jgi:hypothetical protein